MGSLIIHTGSLDHYYYYKKQIIESVKNGQDDYLAVLPVNRAVRLFKRVLIDAAPKQTLIDPPVYTFDELLINIYKNIPSPKRIINSDMQFFLIEELLLENFQRFSYLPGKKNIPAGLVKKVSEMIDELRRFGYTGNEFSRIDIGKAKGTENPLKYEDFTLILNKLEDLLGSRLIDEPFAQHTAADQLNERLFKIVFPEVKKIYISGYGLFTPAMYQFIGKASQWLPVKVKLEYCASNPLLFKHTAEALHRFEKMGAQIIEESGSGTLSACLFNRKLTNEAPADISKRIQIQPLADKETEVEYIAARIRELHLKDKIPLNRIAVTFSNMDRYVPLIRSIFRDYDVPFNLSTGYGLNQSPLIRTFLNCLRLIESGFDYQKTLQLINSSFIKKSEPFNSALVYRILVENRVKYLKRDWTKGLKNISSIDKNNAASSKREQPQFTDNIYQVELLNSFLQPFYKIPQKAAVTKFRSDYINLLNKSGLLNWYNFENKNLSERQRESEFRAFNRFMKLFDKLIWILYHLSRDQEIPLPVFSKYLQTAVEKATFNLTEWPEYGVQIMPRLEIQALDFEALFIGGMIDGKFPRSSVKDIFFNDPVRAKMGLLASEELLDQDRFIFYTLLDSKAETIILTYPKYEEDRALVPSTFLSDLKDAAAVDYKTDLPEPEYLLNLNKLWSQLGFDIQKNKFSDAAPKMQTLLLNDKRGTENPTGQLSGLLERIGAARKRISANGFSIYEGNMTSAAAITERLKQSYGSRNWSITLLEDYAFCPMSFFMKRILKIEEPPQMEEELSSLERGAVVHKILCDFYSKLKDLGKHAEPAQHRDLLFEIAENVFKRLPYEGFFWRLERNKYFGSADAAGLLDVFLEYDQQNINETGFIPLYFEYEFGSSERSKEDSAETLVLKNNRGRLKLTGKIDRIDVNPQGDALVFDYKTGSSALGINARHIAGGLSFQLPFYMLALMEKRPEVNSVYGGYFLVKDAENCERYPVLAEIGRKPSGDRKKYVWLPNKYVKDDEDNELSLDALLSLSLSLALERIEELQNGKFQHTKLPEDKFCTTYCQYKRICQKNVGKLLKMKDSP